MLKRLTGPHAVSAYALAKEVGVSPLTLSKWLSEARNLSAMGKEQRGDAKDPDPKPQKSTRSWSAQEKLRVVLEAAKIDDADLGAFLRREGIHEAQLLEWRRLVLSSLEPEGRAPKKEKKSLLTRRIKELERDLRLKEKELTEAKVLLALKKKLEMLLGGEDDDTNTRSGT
jgi:transposase-like protein